MGATSSSATSAGTSAARLVKLSKDGLKLTWTASSGGKSGSGTDRDSLSKSGGGILRSASFGKTTSDPLSPLLSP